MTNEQNERREAVLAVAQKALDLSETLLEGTTAGSAPVAAVANGLGTLALEAVRLLDENARLQAEIDRLSVPWWRRWCGKAALRTFGAKRIG